MREFTVRGHREAASVHDPDGSYVAYCKSLDVAATGKTRREAETNLDVKVAALERRASDRRLWEALARWEAMRA